VTQRLITAAIGIPLILITLWLGGWWWAIFLAVLAAMDVWEMYRLARRRRRPDLPSGCSWRRS
jgi:CDP-diglyceride synthetase